MELRINDRIRTRKLEHFNQYKLDLAYNSFASSFAFNGYYNPKNKEHVDLYCIGHYHIAYLQHNGELILTGNVVSESFSDEPQKQMAKFSGYSLPGILEDCQIPPSLYPLQSDGLTLREIASKLIKPFGIGMAVDSSVSEAMDEPYEKTTAEPTQSIQEYLTELATQKNIVVSHTSKGNILFTKAQTNRTPILQFDSTRGDSIPFDKMELMYDGRGMHSHIHVIKQASKDGGNAGESEILNPYVPFIYRPTVIIQSSGTDIDTDKVARMALAAELKNLKLVITTDRWELEDGKIIKPNNIITVVNPEIYLFKKSKWFIESISFVGDEKKTTATLTCVLPEVYDNRIPQYMFRGINLH
jgi:prophage tail gpP-like protein